jgi:hypothetical protein
MGDAKDGQSEFLHRGSLLKDLVKSVAKTPVKGFFEVRGGSLAQVNPEAIEL